jgi:hypothetical protein
MDHQHLRLVPTAPTSRETRAHERRLLRVPGQLVWKDSRGTTRLARIVTRDVSACGLSVECLDAGCIPLYRLVYVQIDRAARESNQDLPEPLRRPAVLSAVYRVDPSRKSTGSPGGYALRLLVEPDRATRVAKSEDPIPRRLPAAERIVRSA